jgi:GTP-binding protein
LTSDGGSTLPIVAVVGRPNVGKSTLVNRLAARRGSIVGPTPGLTRDRVTARVSWRGKEFRADDTGGIVEEALTRRGAGSITEKVVGQALAALGAADAVVFVVDITTGVTADDLAVAKRLKRLTVPVLVAANKADGVPPPDILSELWSLGLGEPIAVSALHGRGSGELLDRLVEVLPHRREEQEAGVPPSISIVGRPNVGKSSLFNAIIGFERAIVHDEPGTTRDAIDTVVEVGESSYRFVDTAGLKRHARTKGVEVYGASRTKEAISRSDLAIVVADASEGPTAQDQRIAEAVAESGVGAVVALNKWDLVEGPEGAEAIERAISDRLLFISYAPLVRVSALTRRGLRKLIAEIDPVLDARTIRVSTAELNRLLQDAQQRTPPPRVGNRSVKVLYGTQVGSSPPEFVLFSTGRLAPSWLRFVEHRLRNQYEFRGNPVKLTVRTRKPRELRTDTRAG